MDPSQPEFLYLALILPSLFALTLIAEGIHKILSEESGWLSLCMGIGFLIAIMIGYFFILR